MSHERANPSPAPQPPSSAELFGRTPFSPAPSLRYYGTGVAGYRTGPGFTGEYYGFGDKPPLCRTELEREYLEELYRPDWPDPPPQAAAVPGRRAAPPRYPPGAKGCRRTDQRIHEDLCERLMRARTSTPVRSLSSSPAARSYSQAPYRTAA
ncbi:MAG: hypothetical protein M0038_16055 [Pseudomonadota bacterium]|nr:hypothetical protein [Pseudomonadota bacterium]